MWEREKISLTKDFDNISANVLEVVDALNNLWYNQELEEKFNVMYNMGESFYLSDVYIALNAVPGVIDTTNVVVNTKTTAGYSQYPFNVNRHLSNDGRVLAAPDKVAFEIKDFNADIIGVIK